MQELKRQIKKNELQGVYLFYGEEKFILNTYLNFIIEKLINADDNFMNLDIFEEKSINIDKIKEAVETLPFLGEKRIVVIKEIDALKSNENLFLDILNNIPNSTIIIIIVDKVDKRSKIFKNVSKIGKCVEFKHLNEDELIKYIAEQLNKEGLKIQKSVAKHFIYTVGVDLASIHNELDKLIAFNKDGEYIEKESIDEICTISIENRIFELVDSIGGNKREFALKLFQDLILLKEPPGRILFMIIRQFRLILQTKILLEKNYDRSRIASKLEIPSFALDKFIKQSYKFTEVKIKEALKDCLEAEVLSKNGKIDITLAIELLIIKYS